MQTDLDACALEAKDVHASVGNNSAAYTSSSGVLGAVIGAAIIGAAAEHGARAGYIRRCMYARGYSHVPMTAEEVEASKTSAAKHDPVGWTQAVYDGPDFSARLDAARTPQVPPLPQAPEESLVYAGLRFDPTNLIPATGVVGRGGQVLAGSVSHRRTGWLSAALTTRPYPSITGEVKEHTIFYQVVLPGEDGPAETYWCGEVIHRNALGSRPNYWCFFSDEDGYKMVVPGGQRWHATFVDANSIRVPGNERMEILESHDDLVGSMDLALRIAKIGGSAVTLEAVLSKDGKSETIWTGTLPFDAAGNAVLPFWDHRLVVTRSGDGVTVAFTADGDGNGWNAISGS